MMNDKNDIKNLLNQKNLKSNNINDLNSLFADKSSLSLSVEKFCDMVQVSVKTGMFDQALSLAEKGIELYKGDNSTDYKRLYYYRLLAHFQCTDEFEMVYIWSIRDIKSDPYYTDAVDHMYDDFKDTISFWMEYAKFTKEQKVKMLVLHEKNKEYIQAVRVYKSLGEKKKAEELCAKAIKEMMDREQYDNVITLAAEMLDIKENMELCLKMPEYEKAKEEFKKEVPNGQDYACDVCRKADGENYHKYMDAVNGYSDSGYSEGKGYAISLILALIAAFFIMLDTNRSNTALYLTWGISVTCALSIKFLWDFSLIKSVGGAILLSEAPFVLFFISDSVLGKEIYGAILIFAGTLLAFVLNLKRDIKYSKAKKFEKTAYKIKKDCLDKVLKAEKDRLFEKYAAKTDDKTARRWVKEIDLPICF